MNKLSHWFKRQIANPQILYLATVLIGSLLVVTYAGNMLAPVLVSLVIAYLLESLVKKVTVFRLPRLAAIWLVFLSFMLFLLTVVFVLIPVLYNQITEVVQQIPNIMSRGQAALMALPERYPELFSPEQMQELIANMRTSLSELGQRLVATSLSSATVLIAVIIYTILVPLLVFFFLKDKTRIITWLKGLLPNENQLAVRVWADVDAQIGNYIRGKFWEILIVGVASFAVFSWLQLQFSMLLAVLVGLSVLIPYVGAAVVTIPVVIIAWFQWGWSNDFATLVIAYLVVQALDGNLLVPLLFSEVVNIHPVAIIVAVLFFGGIWGILGVFFAIPLATLVQAIILAWPSAHATDADSA